MSLVLPKLARGPWFAALLLAVLASADAQQPAPRRLPEIRFTEPGAPMTSTNAAQATETISGKPARGALDRTVRKPFELFDIEDSMSGAAALPFRPVRPSALDSKRTREDSKRAREELDRKKNWVFDTPEDMFGLQTPEQMMDLPEYGPDGEVKKSQTRLERYLEREEKNRADAATNRVKDDSLPEWLKPEDPEEKTWYGKDDKVREGSLLGFGLAKPKPAPSNTDFAGQFGGGVTTAEKSYNEFFNLGTSDSGSKPAAPDPGAARRMQIFSDTLKSGSSVSSGLGVGFDATPSGSPLRSPLQSPFSAGGFGRDSFSPQPATRPTSLPSVTPAATLPGAYAPPVRTFTPPASAFELPQRKF